MADYRDDIAAMIKEEDHDIELEHAYFVMLSLYREYSIEMLQNLAPKQECLAKMRAIKEDMKHLEHPQLLNKVEKLYTPLLKQMEHKH